MTLPWKTPRACVVEHALEQLAARAARHGVIDDQRRVDVLGAARQEGAGEIELAALAGERRRAMLVAHERRRRP